MAKLHCVEVRDAHVAEARRQLEELRVADVLLPRVHEATVFFVTVFGGVATRRLPLNGNTSPRGYHPRRLGRGC